MTGSSKQFVERIMAILDPIGSIKTGKFFGGVGLKSNSVQFGMLIGHSLFLVVDDIARQKYLAMGTESFSYMKRTGKVVVKKYHEVPSEIIEQHEVLLAWVADAIIIANKLKKK